MLEQNVRLGGCRFRMFLAVIIDLAGRLRRKQATRKRREHGHQLSIPKVWLSSFHISLISELRCRLEEAAFRSCREVRQPDTGFFDELVSFGLVASALSGNSLG
jgi:hypothetical protein